MTDYATPHVAVSAFCRGVLAKLIPNELYGCGVDGIKNRNIILRHVDTFVQMRRFESLSLHEVSQGLKVSQLVPSDTCLPFNTEKNFCSPSIVPTEKRRQKSLR